MKKRKIKKKLRKLEKVCRRVVAVWDVARSKKYDEEKWSVIHSSGAVEVLRNRVGTPEILASRPYAIRVGPNETVHYATARPAVSPTVDPKRSSS